MNPNKKSELWTSVNNILSGGLQLWDNLIPVHFYHSGIQNQPKLAASTNHCFEVAMLK